MIMQQQPLPMQQQQQQQQSPEEMSNLLIQGLIAKDEKLMLKVLEQEDEAIIKDIINRVPVNHVRKLVIELRNILSTKLSVNHLKWLQNLLALKYSIISSMADGLSILIPLISLLNDRSSAEYYNKVQGLKGKLILLKQLKEARRVDRAETVVRVPVEPEQPAQMEVDSETDTESEEEFGDELDDGEDELGEVELDEEEEAQLEDDDGEVNDDEDDEDDEQSDEM